MNLQTLLEQQLQIALSNAGLPALPDWSVVTTAVVYAPKGGEPQRATASVGSPISAGTGEPIALDGSTPFAIASVSKLFTATLVVDAAQANPSILSDPLAAR